MPQAALAAAVWVGSQVAFAAAAVGASTAIAATAGFATLGATLAAEVYVVAKASQAVTPKISDPGTTTQWQANPRAGAPYLIGRCAAAGDIVFNQSAGSKNKYLNFATVYTWAGPIDGFESFLLNDVDTAFGADSGEGASGYYLNRMWYKHQLGTASDTALRWTATGSKDTPANHGGMPAEWTAQHRLPGFAADLWALEYDTERYAGGVPQRKAVGRWVKAYDARQDSTYPGGSGPQRWNDESTWGFSRNPYCHGLTWLIGRHANGVKIFGAGYDISEIDVAAFVEGANVADANGWTVDGRVTSLDDKWEVLKGILQMGGGLPILGSTQVSCLVNTPKVSLATIRGSDAVGAVTVPGMADPADRINTVWPSYTEEALNWAYVTPDLPVQVPEYVEEDRREISREIKFTLGVNATQVGQLSRYAIEDSRELNGIIIQAKPWTMWLRPGDCITADEPEWGLNGQKLLILKRTRDLATKTIAFTCRTETDGKHPYALGQTNTPPATPTLTNADPSVVPLPGDDAWTIIGGVTAGEDGALPAIVISGEADFYGASQIVVDYREILGPGSYGPWQSQSFPPSAKQLVVTGVKPGAVYQVRVRYVTAGGVENPDTGTGLGNVTTGDVIAKKIAQFGREQLEAIDQAQQQAQATADDARIRVLDAIAKAASADLDVLGMVMPPSGRPVGATLDDQVRKVATAEETIVEHYEQQVAGFANAAAALSVEALTRASADDALSAYQIALATSVNSNFATVNSTLASLTTQQSATAIALTTLTSNFNSNVASVSSQLTTLSNAQSAQASSITTLTSTVGGHTSSISTISSTLSTLNGQVSASFGLQLSVDNKIIGFKGINNGITGGFIVQADYFGISNGLGTSFPFFVSGGVVYMTDVAITGSLLLPSTVNYSQLAPSAALSTARSTASSTVSGSGSLQTILSHYHYLPKDGTVDADAVVAQHFPSGEHNWEMRLYIDGVLQFPPFGANGQDAVPLGGSKQCSAGWVYIELQWSGHSSTNVDYRVLKTTASW